MQFIPIPFSFQLIEFSSLKRLASKWRERVGYLNEIDATYRLFSISRLFFGHSLPNIQASWFRLGMDNAIRSLKAGASDLGETTFDDSVSKNINNRSGNAMTPTKLKAAIKKAGKTPKARLAHK